MAFLVFSYLILVSVQEGSVGNYGPAAVSVVFIAFYHYLKYLDTKAKRRPIIYGKTEAETVKLNNWKKGTVLIGSDKYGNLDRVKITAVGVDNLLCLWDYKAKNKWDEERPTTLKNRQWMEE